jgi:hypothetical protein
MGFGTTDYTIYTPNIDKYYNANQQDEVAKEQARQGALGGNAVQAPQAQGVQLGYVPPAAQATIAPVAPATAGALNYGAMAPGLGVTAGELQGSQQARAQQQGTVNLLGAAAIGAVPSAAEQQLQQGLSAGLRQNLALAASARGTAANQAAARRAAINANAALTAQTQGTTAQLRAGEQAQARSELTGALGALRQQDLLGAQVGTTVSGQGLSAAQSQLGADTQTNLANLQAQQQAAQAQLQSTTQTNLTNAQIASQGAQAQLGADQAVQLANIDAQLQTQGLNAQQRMDYLAKLIGIDNSTAEGQQFMAQLYAQSFLQSQGQGLSQGQANAAVGPQLLGAGISGVSTAGAAGLTALGRGK